MPAALVLEGEAGIGKSTLWVAGVEHARAQGLRVLSSRPAEAEHGLALAGLGDLFEDALEEVLPSLPPPRRRALEVALLLEETDDDPVDPRALGLAVRTTLQSLAENHSLLVAIDDVQWFDDSSARALAFALRRLSTSNLRLLLSRRLVGQPARAGTRASTRRREHRASAGGTAERRCAPPVPARPSRQDLRTSDVASHSRAARAETRSSRSSSAGFWTRTSTRFSRSRFPRRSMSSCAPGSPASPCRPARRSRSRPRSARPRIALLERAGIDAGVARPGVRRARDRA